MIKLSKGIEKLLMNKLDESRSNLKQWTEAKPEDFPPHSLIQRTGLIKKFRDDIACLEQILQLKEIEDVELSNVHSVCEMYDLELQTCLKGFVTLGHGDKDVGLWWNSLEALDLWLRKNDMGKLVAKMLE